MLLVHPPFLRDPDVQLVYGIKNFTSHWTCMGIKHLIPFEKSYNERPILSNLKPFDCRSATKIPVSDENHRDRGQQVIYIGKDFNT